MKKAWMVAAVVVVAATLGLARHGRGQAPRPAPPVRLEATAIGVRVLLGRADRQPTRWDGSIAVSGGSLVGLQGWRFRQDDQVTGPSTWRASTRGQPAQAAQVRRAVQ